MRSLVAMVAVLGAVLAGGAATPARASRRNKGDGTPPGLVLVVHRIATEQDRAASGFCDQQVQAANGSQRRAAGRIPAEIGGNDRVAVRPAETDLDEVEAAEGVLTRVAALQPDLLPDVPTVVRET